MQYTVTVTDDDDPIDCNKVSVTYILGHDTHGHPQTTAFGCSGSITTSVAGGHDPATDDLNAVFSASYTDAGSGNATHSAQSRPPSHFRARATQRRERYASGSTRP